MKTLFKSFFVFFIFLSSSIFSQDRIKKVNQQDLKTVINANNLKRIDIRRTTKSTTTTTTTTTTVFSQMVEAVNGWEYLDLFFGTPDTNKIGSAMGQDTRNYQFFKTYGNTIKVGSINLIQSDWSKEFLTNPLLPDTLAIDVKILSVTPGVTEIWMAIPVQNSLWWSSGYGQKLDLDNSGWQTLKFDRTEEKTFMSYFERGQLSFNFRTKNSSYIGGDIAVSNFRGIDDTLGIVVYDNFTLVGVNDITQVPSKFVLEQNYPNPFNPSTTIRFTLPKREYVSLTVFNLLGQEIKTLVSGEKERGSYEVKFNASKLPSGVYFYRLQAGSFVKTKKMILVK